MIPLRIELDRYLTFRRARGFKLDEVAAYLYEFIDFMELHDEDVLTNALCMDWNTLRPASHGTIQRRMIAIRGFAAWLKALDPRHEIPPPYRGPVGKNRPKPYIYRQEELERLVEQSRRLSSKNGVRRVTYSALWPFLYITGLRIGEALALDTDDINFSDRTIRVEPQKGGYERLVPMHPTTASALQRFLRKRNKLLGMRPTCVFAGEDGQRLKDDTVRQTFNDVSIKAGLRKSEPFQGEGSGPRIHDLRHTFAVNTLLEWYREGKNIDENILILVDVLGHSSLSKTYWYIEAVPELLHLASQRFERHLANESEPD